MNLSDVILKEKESVMSPEQLEIQGRQSLEGVNDMFVRRWSPRQYRSDPVPERDLAIMMEAARWSPSAYNEQPWRFFTSTAESREKFLALLVEANQKWAASAPVIGFLVASTRFDRNDKVNSHAEFDSGSAWMAFNLQASLMGYKAHGMAGIHYEQVYEVLGLNPETQRVICGFTLGVGAEAPDSLTPRKALGDIWSHI